MSQKQIKILKQIKIINLQTLIFLNNKIVNFEKHLNKLEAFTWSIALMVGIENIIRTIKPTKNIFIKLNIENNGLIFNPSPFDK